MTSADLSSAERSTDVHALRSIIDDIEIAMLTTRDGNGEMQSRPLQTQKMGNDNVLWFITRDTTSAARHATSTSQVCLCYTSAERQSFAAVYGRMECLRDRAMLEQLWTPAHKIFFPEGREDPGLVLLKVVPERADIWEGPSGWVSRSLAFAAAFLTKDPGKLGSKRHVEGL